MAKNHALYVSLKPVEIDQFKKNKNSRPHRQLFLFTWLYKQIIG
nr:MAG TPA: hypothetical protein [Caudoviricetes sp.]